MDKNFICEKHNERYQDVHMCYKCLEQLEAKLKKQKESNLKLAQSNIKLSHESKRLREVIGKALHDAETQIEYRYGMNYTTRDELRKALEK